MNLTPIQNNFFNQKALNIIFGINESFCFPCFVTMQSVLEHLPTDVMAHFFILHNGFSEELISIGKQLFSLPNATIDFIDCSSFLTNESLPVSGMCDHWSKENFLPLLIPSIFKEFNQTIVLDADMLVREDLSKILETVPDNVKMSGVRCMIRGLTRQTDFDFYQKNDAQDREIFGLKDPRNYCNGGIFVFNHKNIMEKDAQNCLELTQKNWDACEEPILNKVFEDSLYHLPPKWNFLQGSYGHPAEDFPEEYRELWEEGRQNPAIMHYIGWKKPWFYFHDLPLIDEYQAIWQAISKKAQALSDDLEDIFPEFKTRERIINLREKAWEEEMESSEKVSEGNDDTAKSISEKQLTSQIFSLEKIHFSDQKALNIIFGINESYCFPCFVTMQSVLDHLPADVMAHFFILHNGFSEELISIGKQLFSLPNATIDFIDCSSFLTNESLSVRGICDHWSKETFLPLTIPSLFKNFNQTIFLDADMLVREDLSKIPEAVPDNVKMSGVRCMTRGQTRQTDFDFYQKNDAQDREIFGLKDPRNYCNAGTLIFNHRKITEEDAKKCFQLLEKQWPNCDEPILNKVFEDSLYHLPPKWNFLQGSYGHPAEDFPEEYRELWEEGRQNPAIMHYSGWKKPWFYSHDLPLIEEYQGVWLKVSRKVKNLSEHPEDIFPLFKEREKIMRWRDTSDEDIEAYFRRQEQDLIVSYFFTFLCIDRKNENRIYHAHLCDFETQKANKLSIKDLSALGYRLEEHHDSIFSISRSEGYLSAIPDGTIQHTHHFSTWEKFQIVANFKSPELPHLPQGNSISKHIHQTDVTPLPRPEFQENIETLKNLNPDYEYRYYSEKDIFDFIYTEYGWDILSYYLRINPQYGAAKADLFRYLLMYKYGGVYLDMKSGIKRPLSEILHENDQFAFSHWDDEATGCSFEMSCFPKGEIQQWFMISSAGNPIMRDVILQILANIDLYNPAIHEVGRLTTLRVTGPYAYTRVVRSRLTPQNHRVIIATEEEIYYDVIHNYIRKKDYRINNLPLIL